MFNILIINTLLKKRNMKNMVTTRLGLGLKYGYNKVRVRVKIWLQQG